MSTYQDKLKDELLKIPSAKICSGGKEIVMRCKYCGDSINQRSAHLYVCLGYNDEPNYFHCFKCHTSGLVNHNTLIEWGIYDQDLLTGIAKHHKYTLSLDKNRKYKDSEIYILNNNYISYNKLSEVKLKYINKRIGCNLDYSDILKNKIILNLNDLLISNNIQKLTRHQNIVNELNDSFIGFVSQDNAFVNMRNLREGKVSKGIDKRYVNYNIFEKFNNTQRYYTLPTNIDLSIPKNIKLNIAEGPFDILSIYYNLRNKEGHSIYSAILGSGYLNICKHFITNLGLINLEVHVYIDKDIKYYVVQQLKELLSQYQIPLYLHRNMYEGEKDFGVPIDRITEQIQLI